MKRCEGCHCKLERGAYRVFARWMDGTWRNICEYCCLMLAEWRDEQKAKGAA